MPNDQPRKLSSATPGTQAPKQNKASLPPVAKDDQSAIRKTVGLDKISLRKFDVDPLTVAKHLFNDREIYKDERTAGLVRPEKKKEKQ